MGHLNSFRCRARRRERQEEADQSPVLNHDRRPAMFVQSTRNASSRISKLAIVVAVAGALLGVGVEAKTGNNSCVGMDACLDNTGTLGNNACRGDMVCHENPGSVDNNACNGM